MIAEAKRNPANPDVKGVPRRRVLELFPQAKVSILRKVTLVLPGIEGLAGEDAACQDRFERASLIHGRDRGDQQNMGGYRASASLLQPHRYMAHQEKEREFLKILSRFDFAAIQSKTLLEIGAGFGANILQFLRWDFLPENMTANDCMPDRCAHARKILPTSISVIERNALDLDLPENSFDIILASTVFTSILDREFQQRLAIKIWSLVKPGGAVLWYATIPITRTSRECHAGACWSFFRRRRSRSYARSRWRRRSHAPSAACIQDSIRPSICFPSCALILWAGLRSHRANPRRISE